MQSVNGKLQSPSGLSGFYEPTKGPRPGFEPGSEDPQSPILTTGRSQTLYCKLQFLETSLAPKSKGAFSI